MLAGMFYFVKIRLNDIHTTVQFKTEVENDISGGRVMFNPPFKGIGVYSYVYAFKVTCCC